MRRTKHHPLKWRFQNTCWGTKLKQCPPNDEQKNYTTEQELYEDRTSRQDSEYICCWKVPTIERGSYEPQLAKNKQKEGKEKCITTAFRSMGWEVIHPTWPQTHSPTLHPVHHLLVEGTIIQNCIHHGTPKILGAKTAPHIWSFGLGLCCCFSCWHSSQWARTKWLYSRNTTTFIWDYIFQWIILLAWVVFGMAFWLLHSG